MMNLDNRPDEFFQSNRGMASLRSVGTRGGCGEGRGPGACPAGSAIRLGCVNHDGRTSTRTSTRPLPPLPSSPCPYRTRTPPPSFPHSVGTYHQMLMIVFDAVCLAIPPVSSVSQSLPAIPIPTELSQPRYLL